MATDDFPDAGVLLGKKGKPLRWRDRIDWGCASGCLPVVALVSALGFAFLAR